MKRMRIQYTEAARQLMGIGGGRVSLFIRSPRTSGVIILRLQASSGDLGAFDLHRESDLRAP